MPRLPQSSVILATLALAFLVFITQRGELGTYMGFLFGTRSNPVPEAPSSGSGSGGGGGGGWGDILDTGAKLLPFLL